MIVKQICTLHAHIAINAERMYPSSRPAPNQQQWRNLKATPTSAVVKSSSRVKTFLTSGCFCLCTKSDIMKGYFASQFNFPGDGLLARLLRFVPTMASGLKNKTFAIIFPSASLGSSLEGCLRGGRNVLK